MATKKKLQVFVSSTYKEMIPERQAAVEAILTAGHIPAGMELFAADDKEQMETIKKWIFQSDVFLLILGHQYGTIPKGSKKSYIEAEFDYALEIDKAHFVLILDSKLHAKKVRGFDPNEAYDAFRNKASNGRMVRFWKNTDNIKYRILESLAIFADRSELTGWIPGNQAIDPAVGNQLARLMRENEELKKQSEQSREFNGLSFDELVSILKAQPLTIPDMDNSTIKHSNLHIFARKMGDKDPTLLHVFLDNIEEFASGSMASDAPFKLRTKLALNQATNLAIAGGV